jgi:hypothetical protein
MDVGAYLASSWHDIVISFCPGEKVRVNPRTENFWVAGVKEKPESLRRMRE